MPSDYTPVATYHATIPVPADGEAFSVAVLRPPWTKLADRAAYLKARTPKLYTYSYQSSGSTFFTYVDNNTRQTTVAVGGYIDVPNCVAGDKLLLKCFMTWAIGIAFAGGGGQYVFTHDAWIDVWDDVTGVTPVQQHVPGANWRSLGIAYESVAAYRPLALSGVWTVAQAGTTRATFAFQAPAGFGGIGSVFKIYSAFNINAIRIPAT